MFGSITNLNVDANTKDQDLIYTGDDPIVWDRINKERIRRGLPGLEAIGIPRPADDTQSSVSNVQPTVPASAAEQEQLRQLEARREQLIQSINRAQTTSFTNELTLVRKRQELAQALDPAEYERIQQQIVQLQSTITAENRKVAPLKTQLTTVDQEISSKVQQLFPGLPGLPKLSSLSLPSASAFDKLKSVVVSSPITGANALKEAATALKIPGLASSQVSGLLGSSAAIASQVKTAVSASNGIGKFGLTPAQLEAQGFIKPGAVDNFINSKAAPTVTSEDIAEAARINQESGDPNGITPEQVASNRQLNQVLSSPAMWTGKSGITGLTSLLNNQTVQSRTQQELLTSGVDQLKKLGVVTGNETAAQLGSLAQTAAKFGPAATAAWAKGSPPSDQAEQMNSLAKNALQSVDLVDSRLPGFGAVPFNPAGEVGTVNRAKLDTAVAGLLGNPKIPLPSFGTGGVGKIDQDLYKNTKDEDLVYTGDDNIVWDRINAERLRRGLPGLAAIGYPRPPDDPSQNTTITT